MEISIRAANNGDLTHIIHHRRAMFEEMGYRDAAVLDQVDQSSREYFAEALCTGAYKAWLAIDPNGRILAGGGIVIANWPGFPGENLAKRAWILNMYSEPEARRRGIAKKIIGSDHRVVPLRGFPHRLSSRQPRRPPSLRIHRLPANQRNAPHAVTKLINFSSAPSPQALIFSWLPRLGSSR
jgi:GNAT superfamily N-acetyltransferase